MENLRNSWRGFRRHVMSLYNVETEEEMREREQQEVEEVTMYLEQCVSSIDFLLDRAEGVIINATRLTELKFRITDYVDLLSNKWCRSPFNVWLGYYLPTSLIYTDDVVRPELCRAVFFLARNFPLVRKLSKQFWKKPISLFETEVERREREQQEIEDITMYLQQCVSAIDFLLDRPEGVLINATRLTELKFRITAYVGCLSNKWCRSPFNVWLGDYLPTSIIYTDDVVRPELCRAIFFLRRNIPLVRKLSAKFWK